MCFHWLKTIYFDRSLEFSVQKNLYVVGTLSPHIRNVSRCVPSHGLTTLMGRKVIISERVILFNWRWRHSPYLKDIRSVILNNNINFGAPHSMQLHWFVNFIEYILHISTDLLYLYFFWPSVTNWFVIRLLV